MKLISSNSQVEDSLWVNFTVNLKSREQDSSSSCDVGTAHLSKFCSVSKGEAVQRGAVSNIQIL